MSTTNTSVACVPGAIPGGLSRTSFFNGMFLTQSDLEVEQRFWRMKRRLSNRGQGQGVMWGLRVTLQQSAQKFTLHPGYGVDCCGNDLVVQAAHEVRVNEVIDLSDPAIQALLDGAGETEVALVLEYAECPEEPRPIHKDSCVPTADACEPSRMRETARLTIAALPPPTPTPIAAFVAGIGETRTAHQKANDSQLTELFPDLAPAPASVEDRFPFQLRVSLGESEVIADASGFFGKDVPDEAVSGAVQVVSVQRDGASRIKVQFELVPDAGYVFYAGKASLSSAEGGNASVDVHAPFDVHLAWSFEVDLQDFRAQDGFELPLTFAVRELSFAPFWSSGGRKVVDEFEIALSLRVVQLRIDEASPPSLFTYHACVEQLRLVRPDGPFDVRDAPALSAGPCLNPLEKSFFLGSVQHPLDASKTVLLAALYGWLTNLFGSAQGYPQGGAVVPAVFDGQRTLATWLYLTAWRLLFGANPSAPHSPQGRQELAKLLDSLMAEWCRGFFYVGPRCAAEFHGVVLGTATVSKNGLVTRFDVWKGRRWVLTGPLLQHWGAQLGLAPIDVVAGRLVSSICCLGLAETGAKTKPSMALPPLSEALAPAWSISEAAGIGFAQPSLGQAGILLSDGCYLMFGMQDVVGDLLRQNGILRFERQPVSWLGFVTRLIEALARVPKPGAPPATYVLYHVEGEQGAQPFLVLATDPHVATEREKKRVTVHCVVRQLVAEHQEAAEDALLELEAFPLLSVAPVTDFVTELMFGMPLTALTMELRRRQFAEADIDAVLLVLAEAGVVTCADALALGIESLSDLASPKPEDHGVRDPVVVAIWNGIIETRTAINQEPRSIWERSKEGALEAIGQLERSENQLFRRPTLRHEVFIDLVDKHLRSIVPSDLHDIVMCAAERAAALPAEAAC